MEKSTPITLVSKACTVLDNRLIDKHTHIDTYMLKYMLSIQDLISNTRIVHTNICPDRKSDPGPQGSVRSSNRLFCDLVSPKIGL